MTIQNTIIAVFICAVLGACGGNEFTVDIAFSPTIPVPLKPLTVQVDVSNSDGKVKGATVSLSGDGPAVTAPKMALKESSAGRYTADNFEFLRTGKWTVKVDVTFDGTTETHTKTYDVTCKGGGILGEPCCVNTHCDDGLSCVFAACASGPNNANSGCYNDAECTSGVCKKGVCQAAACNDFLKNGDETDEDCGGSCDKCERAKACMNADDCASGFCTNGVCTHDLGSLLGDGTNAAKLTVITKQDMFAPTDLAFSTAEEGKLWVTHLNQSAYTVITAPGEAGQSQVVLKDNSAHFSEKNMGIAFTDAGVFATCGDTRNSYNGKKKENDFMGPVMWPGQVSKYNVNSVAGAHLDMLHQSPLCMGIGADVKHSFYCFNGLEGTLDWYDFNEPHEPGGDDHSDGRKRRYHEAKVTRKEGVPSNISVDTARKIAFIADSGGGRVLRVDVSAAVEGNTIPKWGNDGTMYAMSGAKVSVLVDKGQSGLAVPSGLAYLDGVVYVGDHATGKIHCFNADDGKELRAFDTGLGAGAIGGLTIRTDGELKIYFTNIASNQILRLDP